ncbi:hypothetical protein [Aliagarivorans marinus]|uniref:hypothetical protein n=1 Tax=Aliagarivorans marinus TaxID=561965 RepID=UPI00041CBF0E|nr:hypothetical protein [Aliagarivorans marinus]
MITQDDFIIQDNKLSFKDDEYNLNRIRNARFVKNSLVSSIVRIIAIGLVVSSIVWIICPEGFGRFFGPLSFCLGVIGALLTSYRYELQIEFRHSDETGFQWISVAKSNKNSVLAIFDQQAQAIATAIT